MREHAAELGVRASSIAIAGTSAGANLAAGCVIAARDAGVALPQLQILLYPIVDADFDTDSYRANGAGFGITREHLMWFWDQYAPDGRQRSDPRAAPLRADDLTGLPPAVVVTAEFDPLRDEAEMYAVRLVDAGVPVVSVRFNGMFHGFLEAQGSLSAADAAFDLIAGHARFRLGA
jgi:acetyl esterase